MNQPLGERTSSSGMVGHVSPPFAASHNRACMGSSFALMADSQWAQLQQRA
jgi:hypothetical protein